jgi:hypothetical protein
MMTGPVQPHQCHHPARLLTLYSPARHVPLIEPPQIFLLFSLTLQLVPLWFDSLLAIAPQLFLLRSKSVLAVAPQLFLLWFNSFLTIKPQFFPLWSKLPLAFEPQFFPLLFQPFTSGIDARLPFLPGQLV